MTRTRRGALTAGLTVGGALGLAACGAASGGGSGGSSAAPANTKGPVEIYFALPASPGLEADLYTGFINDFQAKQPKIKVRYTFEPVFGDFPAKLKAMMAADTYPDVAHQHLSVVQDFAGAGALLPLKSYMNRDKVSEKDFIPALITEFTYKGQLMAIPKDSAAFGLYYNMDMFDKAGIKYPGDGWTWDDFLDAAKRLTKPDINQFAISFIKPDPTSENNEAILKSFGGGWYNEDRSKSLIDSAGSVEALQFFADLEYKHRLTPSAYKFQFTGDAWRGGVVAMTFGHHSTAWSYRTQNPPPPFKFDVTPVPKGRGGQFVAVGASGYALPVKAQYKDQGWELIKFLTSKEIQSTIASGHRWGPCRLDSIDNLAWPDNIPAHFRDVHVEPLKGKGKVQMLPYVFPQGQLDILQVYNDEIGGKLWSGQASAKEAAGAAKPKIDAILARNK